MGGGGGGTRLIISKYQEEYDKDAHSVLLCSSLQWNC